MWADDHEDHVTKREKRQFELSDDSELHLLSTYTFTTPPNLLDYRTS